MSDRSDRLDHLGRWDFRAAIRSWDAHPHQARINQGCDRGRGKPTFVFRFVGMRLDQFSDVSNGLEKSRHQPTIVTGTVRLLARPEAMSAPGRAWPAGPGMQRTTHITLAALLLSGTLVLGGGAVEARGELSSPSLAPEGIALQHLESTLSEKNTAVLNLTATQGRHPAS